MARKKKAAEKPVTHGVQSGAPGRLDKAWEERDKRLAAIKKGCDVKRADTANAGGGCATCG